MTRGVLGWMLVVLQFALLALLILVPRSDATSLRILLGAVPLLAGVALGLWAGSRLGTALTPTPVPRVGAGLRTDGPYSRLRHPIYTAVILGASGFTIAVGSLWTLVVLVLLVVLLGAKARWEDALLHEVHGQAWEEWSAHTGALVPRLGRPRHPA